VADDEPQDQPEEGGELEERSAPRRDQDLLGRRNANAKGGIRVRLDELFGDVEKGFQDQADRADAIADYWDCYNCVANGNRYYNGIADIYFPIIHDAIEARVTRFVNQLFPQGGRYVQCIAADGSTENALVALLDHYIDGREAKTQVVEPLIRNGDVEGQYNLYVDWAEVERQIVSRETHGPKDPETGMEAPGDEIEDIAEEDVIEGFPVLEVLHDSDVLVLPVTADTEDEALARGGSVTIVRRWGKSDIDRLRKQGEIREDEAKILKDEMGKVANGADKDIEKRLLEAAHIKKGGKECTVWETWTMLPLKDGKYNEDGEPRLCRVFLGPQRALLGAKRNPYWNDRCPLLSRPVKKMSGAFKGPSLISYVDSLQYEANDAANEGADAATLSAAPIVARDPEKYNGPLVFNMGAIWDIAPGAVELLTFPDLTPRAMTRVQMAIQQIFQTLGVNPSMLPQQTRSGKPNQAQVAQEQAVDLLTTATAVTVIERGILTRATALIVDYDYQFRDRDITIRMYGSEGKRAVMQEVGPLQNRHGFTFTWRGGEQVRQNAMTQQQGTGMMNVLRGMRQDLMAEGYMLRIGPLAAQWVTNAFGPEQGSNILVDQRDQLTIPQGQENEMLLDGFMVPVHPLDNDEQHIPVAMQAIQQTGDPHGTLRVHLQAHLQQRQAKAQAQMMQKMAQQMQGAGGGQPGIPGGPQRPGMPQQGANPAGPRLIKGPPGAVHPDNASRAGGLQMPRKY
jgi:hypothetical protein